MAGRFKPDEHKGRLKGALDAYDRAEAGRLCEELVVHLRGRVDPYPTREAKDVLGLLRKKRRFDHMARVADAFLRAGVDDPQVRRQYAQSLLDMGNVSAALDVLQRILDAPGLNAKERAEVQGLVGRGYKQIYMDAADTRPTQNQAALRKAVEAYFGVYQSDETQLWHGVNAVSLLLRAHRDRIQVPGAPDPAAVARRIADEVEELHRDGKASMWDLATGAEAWVALKEFRTAGEWLDEYIGSPQADAFELGSTYRQFSEVMELEKDEKDEGYLLDLLRGALIMSQGGALTTSADEMARRAASASEAVRGLEKVLGDTRYVAHEWLLRAFGRARSVGRVWRRGSGLGVGSGFLLPGELLRAEWKGRLVFLTNSHVVSKAPVLTGTLQRSQAEVSFDVAEGGAGKVPPRHPVKELLWESPIPELVTTVLWLEGEVVNHDTFEVAQVLPKAEQKDRIYVIGHPHGGDLSYSIQDNAMLAINATRIHYRSPTEPGSSGSPLFNSEWEIVGIHHAGDDHMSRLDDPNEVYPANEGIPLHAIIAAVGKG